MKKYKYQILRDSEVQYATMNDINKQGKEGWRIVTYSVNDDGNQLILMEKEIK